MNMEEFRRKGLSEYAEDDLPMRLPTKKTIFDALTPSLYDPNDWVVDVLERADPVDVEEVRKVLSGKSSLTEAEYEIYDRNK